MMALSLSRPSLAWLTARQFSRFARWKTLDTMRSTMHRENDNIAAARSVYRRVDSLTSA